MSYKKQNFPRDGWSCINVVDHGEAIARCDACGRHRIRHAHMLTHPQWPQTIECGCICAGKLEGDIAKAKRREKIIHRRSARRHKWTDHKQWNLLPNGVWKNDGQGWQSIIYPTPNGWAGLVRHLKIDYEYHCPGNFKEVDEARLAVFDARTKIEALELHLNHKTRQASFEF